MDPEAAKVWRSLAEAVNEMRTATAADVVAFERMVAAVHLAGRAHADPDARVTAKIAADRNALCWLSEFGLTPQKRQGVASLATVTPGDPLDEFV
jgi:phage terminase small subunit